MTTAMSDAATGAYYVEVRHGGCRTIIEFTRVPDGVMWRSLVPFSDASIEELVSGEDYDVSAECIGPANPEHAVDTAMYSLVDNISEGFDWQQPVDG